MSYEKVTIDIFQSASPEVGTQLFRFDMLQEVCDISKNILNEYELENLYTDNELQAHFKKIHEYVSMMKHIEIHMENNALFDWVGFVVEMSYSTPQIAYVGGKAEIAGDGSATYYFDFVPVAYKETGFALESSLIHSLEQQFEGAATQMITLFTKKIYETIMKHNTGESQRTSLNTDSTDKLEEMLETTSSSSQEGSAKEPDAGTHSRTASTSSTQRQRINQESTNRQTTGNQQIDPTDLALDVERLETQIAFYREEINRERYTKERMRLANQKLEVLMDQVEKKILFNAIDTLKEDKPESAVEDWHKYLKLDLREYTQLMQKGKHLEQIWAINNNLITKFEKMVISDSQLTYEREQVKEIKGNYSANEIYLVLDECSLIEQRVKIKKKTWFRKPCVKIMKMDYESLQNKAMYFDLLQSESYLLERSIASFDKEDILSEENGTAPV